ncbi:MAG TPA: hypothetical protein VD741_00105, partial [Solirubrobacterales bacterium]|nr:hypothetical protein [Solirubrobacterales bacterium]
MLTVGIGLLLCSVANALSRADEGPAMAIYWLGLLLIALPIFYRLTSREASVHERLALVLLLGLGLYLVKVMRDSPLFTFSDEQVHAFNANRIDETDALFKANPILEVTPYYPGLEAATTALMKLTGLSIYPAGIILVGVARLVMLASLFLLFARVSSSARAAGLGVAIYAGNFNFLFWSAQYSYESLALPLLLMMMMGLAEREASPREAWRAWAFPILLAIAAVVVTHHLTSYATAVFLLALAITYWLVNRTWRQPNPWPFAAAAITMAGLWLLVVASSTVGYLSPVLSNAVDAIGNTIGGEDRPRKLFEGGSPAVEPTPLVAKGVAVLAILLLAAALPFGLREIYRRHLKKPFALLFAIAAVLFFGTLALRLAPLAWETGNRLSEFLFVGLAFTLSCALAAALGRFRDRARWRLAAAGALGLILVGGAISGWPWDSQLAKPMRISVDGRTLPSPSLSAAEWSRERIEGGRFAATNAGAGLLLVPGKKVALAGSAPAVEDVLDAESFEGWELPLLERNKLRYVVADRREASSDTLRGH